jgi:hypothetical protein
LQNQIAELLHKNIRECYVAILAIENVMLGDVLLHAPSLTL